eukprot:763661-Hanusia_phi.AAC.2
MLASWKLLAPSASRVPSSRSLPSTPSPFLLRPPFTSGTLDCSPAPPAARHSAAALLASPALSSCSGHQQR